MPKHTTLHFVNAARTHTQDEIGGFFEDLKEGLEGLEHEGSFNLNLELLKGSGAWSVDVPPLWLDNAFNTVERTLNDIGEGVGEVMLDPKDKPNGIYFDLSQE